MCVVENNKISKRKSGEALEKIPEMHSTANINPGRHLQGLLYIIRTNRKGDLNNERTFCDLLMDFRSLWRCLDQREVFVGSVEAMREAGGVCITIDNLSFGFGQDFNC